VSMITIMRCKAHDSFDPIWRSKVMTRNQAYEWLGTRLGLHPDECHISLFDEDMCQQVMDTCLAMKFQIGDY
jgi:hypothetical protein